MSFTNEICDLCGSEFELGYWRDHLNLCPTCATLEEFAVGGMDDAAAGADEEPGEGWGYPEDATPGGGTLEALHGH